MTRRDPFPVLDFRACPDWPGCDCDGECAVDVSRTSAGHIPLIVIIGIVLSIAGLLAVAFFFPRP